MARNPQLRHLVEARKRTAYLERQGRCFGVIVMGQLEVVKEVHPELVRIARGELDSSFSRATGPSKPGDSRFRLEEMAVPAIEGIHLLEVNGHDLARHVIAELESLL